jgi:hypothetical protein
MLQFEIIQATDETVTSVAPIFARMFELLSGGKTTVREIAVQKGGGVVASKAPGVVPFEFGNSGYARLRLIFPDPRKEAVGFLAPSHVPSPQIDGAGLAILEIMDVGFSPVTSPGNLAVARSIGAHAYLDEIP